MKIGDKAIALEGSHTFAVGEEIEYLGTNNDMIYAKYNTIYDFKDKDGISQHLIEDEFKAI